MWKPTFVDVISDLYESVITIPHGCLYFAPHRRARPPAWPHWSPPDSARFSQILTDVVLHKDSRGVAKTRGSYRQPGQNSLTLSYHFPEPNEIPPFSWQF